jgi:hypothetical protein
MSSNNNLYKDYERMAAYIRNTSNSVNDLRTAHSYELLAESATYFEIEFLVGLCAMSTVIVIEACKILAKEKAT